MASPQTVESCHYYWRRTAVFRLGLGAVFRSPLQADEGFFRPQERLRKVRNAPSFPVRLTQEGAMGPTACSLEASLIDWIEGPRSDQGRPRCPTEAVVETLQFFLREGVQWRELRATGVWGCGAPLRRRLPGLGLTAFLRLEPAAVLWGVRSWAVIPAPAC